MTFSKKLHIPAFTFSVPNPKIKPVNKIHNSSLEHITKKINIRVKPEYADDFLTFLKTKGYDFHTDGNNYPVDIVGVGEVICRPFLLDYSDKLRDDTRIWDSEVDVL